MKFENLVEIIRIRQEVREVEEPYTSLLPQQIRSSHDATALIQALIGDEDREVFLVLCLNMKNHVTAVHRCHVGSLNASLVHPREVFKPAILNNAASILVAHNHPSGDCQYSPEDIDVSKRLQEAGSLLSIELLDSIIVSPSNSLSLKEKGVI